MRGNTPSQVRLETWNKIQKLNLTWLEIGLITSLVKNHNDIGKLLNHPKASLLLGALLGGMGGGAPGMFGGEDEGEKMKFEFKQNTLSETMPKAKPKEEENRDPRADLSEEHRNVKFLLKYAAELCPTVITNLKNLAGN